MRNAAAESTGTGRQHTLIVGGIAAGGVLGAAVGDLVPRLGIAVAILGDIFLSLPPILVAVGPSGSGYSRDDGTTWTLLANDPLNTVAATPGALWAAGAQGLVAKGPQWILR